jgi:hypothetical protein
MTGEPFKASATSAQLRADIDSGRTGDKVPALDPAAAPLGTDEEAAGTPTAPEMLAMARSEERARVPTDGGPREAGPPQSNSASDSSGRRSRSGLFAGAAIGIAGAVLLWALYFLFKT